MKNVYTYHDGNTHTKCSRKLALAFLIAQNGGEVYRLWRKTEKGNDYERVGRIVNQGDRGSFLATWAPNASSESWERITPEMRENARKLIGDYTPRKYYLIDFVYTENGQQFGTGADLNATEVEKLEAYLQELVEDGYITDPHVHEPGEPIHQSYVQARKEIAKALGS